MHACILFIIFYFGLFIVSLILFEFDRHQNKIERQILLDHDFSYRPHITRKKKIRDRHALLNFVHLSLFSI